MLSDAKIPTVASIREKFRSQKELWQRVPYLALLAYGRDGFTSMDRRAYAEGFFALHGTRTGGAFTIYVDCASGELLDAIATSQSQELITARDEDIEFFARELSEVDAHWVVHSIKRAIERPMREGLSYNEDALCVFHEDARKQQGITEVFTDSQRGIINSDGYQDM